MDETNVKQSFLSGKNMLPLLLGVVGLIFFGYGLMSLSAPQKDKPDILFEAASDINPSAMVTKEVKEITVDVEGAVMKPGVYTLKENSRMQDAIVASGGMSDEADRERVAKTLNLASKITDGAKIYIPFVGESNSLSTTADMSLENQESEYGETININTASSAELEALPGIGEVTAGKIIDNRPYSSIEELLEKKIVGRSIFEKIKDEIGI